MPKPTKPEIELAVAGQKAKASTYNDNMQSMLDYVDECMDYAVLADLSNLDATGEAHFVKPNVAVTHTTSTAVGTSSRPVYVNSSGVATACSGIDTTNLCCTTQATTTSSASSTKPAVITQNYKSGTSWYRVWSDGWIEQGGVTSTLTTSNNNTNSIYFPKDFTTTDYSVLACGHATQGNNSAGLDSFHCAPETTSYFNISVDWTSSSVVKIANWYACGY